MKKLLSVILMLFIFSPRFCSSYKKVKILVPMRVKHIHHTKVVKVPEYHHYFHDKGRPRRKERFPQAAQEDYYNQDSYGITDNFNNNNNNVNNNYGTNNNNPMAHTHALYDDFDYYPENSDNSFERVYYKIGNTYNRHPANHNQNNNRNKFEPQHFFHRV